MTDWLLVALLFGLGVSGFAVAAAALRSAAGSDLGGYVP